MTASCAHSRISYFGKIPSRADFVKSTGDPALLGMLDEWLAGAMECVREDARWKLMYDAMQPLRFAFLGTRSGSAIAGHVVPGADASGRRFPFVTTAMTEVDRPAAFVPNSPLILSGLWHRLESLTGAALASSDPACILRQATNTPITPAKQLAACETEIAGFMKQQTLGTLDVMLAQAGCTVTLRQILLALGMLLQPVMAAGLDRLEKSLVLPLPEDAAGRDLVCTFWMHVITPFLTRADFELTLFVTRLAGRPVLIVGFDGPSPRSLHAAIDGQAALDRHIAFDSLGWVEQQAEADYGIKKASLCLAQPGLSLTSARELLHAAFIGY
jgi:type VI secretion system protein ImpM